MNGEQYRCQKEKHVAGSECQLIFTPDNTSNIVVRTTLAHGSVYIYSLGKKRAHNESFEGTVKIRQILIYAVDEEKSRKTNSTFDMNIPGRDKDGSLLLEKKNNNNNMGGTE